MEPKLEDIEEIYHAALEKKSRAEQATFIEVACKGNLELQARVEALLEANNEVGDFLEESVLESDITLDMSDMTEEPGINIGRYKLLEKIGEGGFGVVWAAEQKRPVKRRVALKIIKLGMDTKQVVARFEAERQALALMDHPNIAKVLDAGSTDTGRPYFIMELVKGIPIIKYCDQERNSIPDRLNLFMKVCHAIQHAHQKGIIHRDIKPSNILITLHDGVPVPRVIDFGIAKATQQELTDKTIYTQHHQFIGTPTYMSPEQAEMSGLDIDTRSDVYSLGVLLYELLTGKTPFEEKELLQQGLDAMRRVIREQEPQKPSTKFATLQVEEQSTTATRHSTDSPRLISLLRGDLDWIVMKCLEKDRTRRYETASGLAADVDRYLSHEPVVARPPTLIYRFQKAWRRNRVMYSAGLLVFVSLAVGLAFASLGLKRAVTAQRLEAQQREIAQTNERKANEAQASEAKLRQRADRNARQARLNLYSADMTLAQHSLRENNLGQVHRLLDLHRPQPGAEDLRGWEWRYLWHQARGSAHVTLTQRSVRGWDVSLSPDGSHLAVGWLDGQVDLWDVANQRLIRTLIDSGNPAGAHVAFSPVQNILALTSEAKVVSLYDLGTGSDTSLWQAPERGNWRIHRLSYSQDGSKLAIYAASGTTGISDEVWVVDVSSPQIKSRHQTGYGTWNRHFGGAQLSRDGQRLYLAYFDHKRYGIQCLDLVMNRELWQTDWQDDRALSSLTLSPDGRLLASSSGTTDGTIRIWDATSGQLRRSLFGHTRWVCSLDFSQDGRELISAACDQTICCWDTETWSKTRVLRGHRDEVHAVAVSKPAGVIVSASKDGALLLWNTEEGDASRGGIRLPENLPAGRVRPLDGWRMLLLPTGRPPAWLNLKGPHDNTPMALPELGSSEHVLDCFGGKILCRWDESDQMLIYAWRGDRFVLHKAIALNNTERPTKVVYNAVPELLAWAESASSDLIYVTHLAAPSRRFELRGDVPGLIPVAFNKEGHHLLARVKRENIWRVWHIKTGQIVLSINEPVADAVFAADGRVLVTTSADEDNHEISFYDLSHPNEPFQRISGRFGCYPLRASPDGSLVAGSTRGGKVILVDPFTGKLITTLHSHMTGANNVAFSPDGRRLLSVGALDAKLWDVSTHRELLTLSCERRPAYWTADGQAFFVGAGQAWWAPSFGEIADVEAREKLLGGQQ